VRDFAIDLAMNITAIATARSDGKIQDRLVGFLLLFPYRNESLQDGPWFALATLYGQRLLGRCF
jgi:hypothetical protein